MSLIWRNYDFSHASILLRMPCEVYACCSKFLEKESFPNNTMIRSVSNPFETVFDNYWQVLLAWYCRFKWINCGLMLDHFECWRSLCDFFCLRHALTIWWREIKSLLVNYDLCLATCINEHCILYIHYFLGYRCNCNMDVC